MPLPDLLQWLGTARKTGTLQLEADRVRKWIQLREGQIHGCSSDDPPERLGHFLLSRGRITEDQLRIGLAAQQSSQRHLGKIFVEMGTLSHEDLCALLEAKAEETIFSLFDWEDGVFRFHEELTELPNVFPVTLSVGDVLLRGMKRHDEVRRIRQVLDDPAIVLRHSALEPPDEVLENHVARALYDAVDGERTVAEILLHVHGSEYLVTKFLYELHRNGYLEIAGVRSAETAVPEEAPVEEPAREPLELDADLDVDQAVRELDLESDFADPPGPDPELDLEPDLPPPLEQSPSTAPELQATPGTASATAVEEPEELLGIPEVFTQPSAVEAVEESEAYQMGSRLERVRVLMSANDYEQALGILDDLCRRHPSDDSLRKLAAEAEAAFIDKAYRHYLHPNRIPVLTRAVEELEAQNLSPTEFFMLSRIDGSWDIRSIVQIAPLREVESLLTLKNLREKGVIDLRDPATRQG